MKRCSPPPVTLPPDAVAALERALPEPRCPECGTAALRPKCLHEFPPDTCGRHQVAAEHRHSLRRLAAELAPLLAEREAKLAEALARVERWQAAQKLAVAKGLETTTRLAEAVASEGGMRAALVDFRGHLKYIEMKARRLTTGNVSHDGPHIANISEIRRRQVEAALAAPPSRSLAELRELRAALNTAYRAHNTWCWAKERLRILGEMVSDRAAGRDLPPLDLNWLAQEVGKIRDGAELLPEGLLAAPRTEREEE